MLLDEGIDEEAAHVITSLAEIYVDTDRPAEAEQQARRALGAPRARQDFISEIGTAQLTLGRALLGQGRLDEAQETLVVADSSFEQMFDQPPGGSGSPRGRCRQARRRPRGGSAIPAGSRDTAGLPLLGPGKEDAAVSKAKTLYWLSMAVLIFAPLSVAVGPLGFFDGAKGD